MAPPKTRQTGSISLRKYTSFQKERQFSIRLWIIFLSALGRKDNALCINKKQKTKLDSRTKNTLYMD